MEEPHEFPAQLLYRTTLDSYPNLQGTNPFALDYIIPLGRMRGKRYAEPYNDRLRRQN
jgi:hypothetical protein